MSLKNSRVVTSFLIIFFIISTFFVTDVDAAQVTWTVETVDAALSVGGSNSISLDSMNRPHISYHDNYWNDLKYAKYTGSSWSIEPVDTPGFVGFYTCLCLDSLDRPHIAYTDEQNSDLKYAWYTGSSWSKERVDNASSSQVSLCLDSTDRPHIVYQSDTGYLKYAKWTGSTWILEIVDSGISAEMVSLDLDSLNHPHISFHDPINYDLKYARWTGSAWSVETIDSTGSVGKSSSIAVDSNNKPHISYSDATNGNLKYSKFTGTTWVTETVDAAQNVGGFTSLALDSYDNPNIGYFDQYWMDLKYAKLTDLGWLIVAVDTVDQVGSYPSISLDSTNHPHISYYDSSHSNLKYARDPDEHFFSVTYSPFDDDADTKDDSVEVIIDVDTSHSGSLNVFVFGYLEDSLGVLYGFNSSSWQIDSNQVELESLILKIPETATEDNFDIHLQVSDDCQTIEDTKKISDAVYLYPPKTNQNGYLTGTVTDMDTGLPMQGVEIYVDENPDSGTIQVETDTNGQYYLELSEGQHEITAHESEGSLYLDQSINVTIIANVLTTQDFQLQRSNWILTISVIGSGITNPAGSITIPADSWTEVEAFPEEGWILDYWLLDSENIGSENPISVLMNSEHSLTAIFNEESDIGLLAGQVTDYNTGSPITEAEVSVNGTSIFTDPLGNYEFELEPGEYNLTVSKLDYDNETRFVTVIADEFNTQDFVLHKSNYTLVIEIEGVGSTSPVAGMYDYSFETEILVEIFPSLGWRLGNYLFDSIWYSPEDAFTVIMNNNHELIVVFIEDVPLEPFIESCNVDGGQKDSFGIGEDLYITGDFFLASGTFELYIINDVEVWTDGMLIPSRVTGSQTTLSSNVEGFITSSNVWSNIQTEGKYDIIIDVNDNGIYDVGVDALDDGDIQVTAGVEIIPEINSLITFTSLILLTMGVIIYKRLRVKN